MSVVEEKEVAVTCIRKKNAPLCLGRNDEQSPHPDFEHLPRPITTPLEKTKNELTEHIVDDGLKEIVYQMHRGEFEAKLKYTKKDDGTECLEGIFGVHPASVSFITHKIENCPADLKAFGKAHGEFGEGFGTAHNTDFFHRLWHHTLRQHSLSLPCGAVELVLDYLLSTYVGMGDDGVELIVDAVVIAADCFSTGHENHVCKSAIFDKVGVYLEFKGRFGIAAAVYEIICHNAAELSYFANGHSHIGSTHKHNKDYNRSEASFIKLLHYRAKSNGDTVDFGDSETQDTLCKLLALYHDLGVGSNQNMVQRSVIAILLMGGYETNQFYVPSFERILKKDYQTAKKAQELFTRAILSGTQSDFRQICLSAATEEDKEFQVRRVGTQSVEQDIWAAKRAAISCLQQIGFGHWIMSAVEEKEVAVTCTRKKNAPLCLGGNDEQSPHPDFEDLPRPITAPVEKTKNELTEHIVDDGLKEIVYQMHRGEFEAKLKYTKKEDGTESLEGMFGVHPASVSLITHTIEICRADQKLRAFGKEFDEGFGTAHNTDFFYRLWHHTLRQHSLSLPCGAVELVLTHLISEYVDMGDDGVELIVDAVVIAADCFSTGHENHVCKNEVFSKYFDTVGIYLEFKGRFGIAAAVHEVVCRIKDHDEAGPRLLATEHSHIGSTHKHNKDYNRSEASFIKSLHYGAKSNGNMVNFGESGTQATLSELLALYRYHDLGVGSNEDMVQRSVIAILLMGGYETNQFYVPSFERILKKDYQTAKKAQELFTRAILSGTQSDFRQICLSAATEEDKEVQVRRTGSQSVEQDILKARSSAIVYLDRVGFGPSINKIMSVVEEKEAKLTCVRKKNARLRRLGGNDEQPPHPDFEDLPRPFTTPFEKKKKQLVKYIGCDSVKEIVYQMHRGEFEAYLLHTRHDDGTECLIGMFGAHPASNYLIGHMFEICPNDSQNGWGAMASVLFEDNELTDGLGTEQATGFLLRLWHHILRQHSSSLPSGVVTLGLTHLLRAYVSQGDKCRMELLVDAVVIAADCFSTGQENHVCQNGFCEAQFKEVGKYLESKGKFAAAAAMYGAVCRIHDRHDGEPGIIANIHSHIGSSHKHNQDYNRSEASFIKSLHYRAKSNGDTVDFGDSDTQATLSELLALYHDLGVGSNQDMVERSVIAILLMGGYETNQFSMPRYKSFLQKDYQTAKKAQELFTRAILSGTQSDFRQICLSAATEEDKVVQVRRLRTLSVEQHIMAAKQAASDYFQRNCARPTISTIFCSYCKTCQIDDEDCALMRCPCKAVVYCKKECQTAHWTEHKKHCAHHFKKKKSARKN